MDDGVLISRPDRANAEGGLLFVLWLELNWKQTESSMHASDGFDGRDCIR